MWKYKILYVGLVSSAQRLCLIYAMTHTHPQICQTRPPEIMKNNSNKRSFPLFAQLSQLSNI